MTKYIAIGNLIISFHKTTRKGFHAEIMRWEPSGEFNGILLRGFGFRFMVHGL